MKHFSSQFIFTNTGPPLKRGGITTNDDGTIISVDDTLIESHSVEFHNGIIIPGFVNCHCHLEISHLKGTITGGKGLAHFIMELRNTRDINTEDILSRAKDADRELYNEGVVLCADICNTDVTFELKKKSSVSYYNLLEIYGIDPGRTHKRITEILKVEAEALRHGLQYSLTPHSAYSVSLPLFRYLKEKSKTNKVTSIHFLESEEEKKFLSDHSGPLMESYEKSGIMPEQPETPASHADVILNEVTDSGNLILVHNTFADRKTIREINRRSNIFWCLCPASNMYISGKIPPVDILISEGCSIVVGTDSLASNRKLSILSELSILQEHFPYIGLEEMVQWATVNGAKALGEDQNFGKIEPGKKPGLLLLQDIDLLNLRLLPESHVTRLI
jgi:cytosine/adenosine deaminase-related metal-dependent hydrolase